jgi:uncharacterized membrane protein
MRLIIAAFALVISGPVTASQTYDVSGVEWGDVLNIRAKPSSKSAIIGAIPYNGRGVDVTGSTSKNWVRVQYRDHTGYVLRKFLTEAQVENGPLPVALQCHGTEPFWTIKIGPNSSSYQMMDEAPIALPLGAFEQASNRSDGWMAVGGSGNNLTAAYLTRAEACSNGMSDETFPYSIHVRLPTGGVVSGCCKQ